MATVHVTLSHVDDRSQGGQGASVPVIDSVPVAAETITSSASNSVSTIAAAEKLGLFWSVTAKGGDVWVKFAAAPVAGSGGGHLVLTGQTRDFSVNTIGEKIAVKDA